MLNFSAKDRYGWPKRLANVNIRNFNLNGMIHIAKEFCGYSIVTGKHSMEELRSRTKLKEWEINKFVQKVETGFAFKDKKGGVLKISEESLEEIRRKIEFADNKGDSFSATQFNGLMQDAAIKDSNSTIIRTTVNNYKKKMKLTKLKAQRKTAYRLEAESDLRNIVSAAVAFQASVEGIDACQILNIDATQFLIAHKDNVITCVVPLERDNSSPVQIHSYDNGMNT